MHATQPRRPQAGPCTPAGRSAQVHGCRSTAAPTRQMPDSFRGALASMPSAIPMRTVNTCNTWSRGQAAAGCGGGATWRRCAGAAGRPCPSHRDGRLHAGGDCHAAELYSQDVEQLRQEHGPAHQQHAPPVGALGVGSACGGRGAAGREAARVWIPRLDTTPACHYRRCALPAAATAVMPAATAAPTCHAPGDEQQDGPCGRLSEQGVDDGREGLAPLLIHVPQAVLEEDRPHHERRLRGRRRRLTLPDGDGAVCSRAARGARAVKGAGARAGGADGGPAEVAGNRSTRPKGCKCAGACSVVALLGPQAATL